MIEVVIPMWIWLSVLAIILMAYGYTWFIPSMPEIRYKRYLKSEQYVFDKLADQTKTLSDFDF